MTDSYQPIYDAVRSRIGGGNVTDAIVTAIRDANLSHFAAMAAESIRCAAAEYERPSVVFRPCLYLDGDAWCALYGEDLMVGVAGFGDSPGEAMRDFDAKWAKKLEKNP